MDRIVIERLEVFARHGLHDAEKTLGQKFLVSLELRIDLHGAAQADDIGMTVNYAEVCDLVVALMQERAFNLIEACAEKIAISVLMAFKTAKEVSVKIEKPHAPIKHSFGCAAVVVSRKRETVFIGLGSNMGDRAGNLDRAVSALSFLPELAALKVSSYHNTKPVSRIPQGDFLNAVVMAEAVCRPESLMESLLALEAELGRVRGAPQGPRVIDLDLLFFGDAVTDSAFAALPHPRLHERLFVLEPLCELAPYFVHPILRKRVFELRDDLRKIPGMFSRLV